MILMLIFFLFFMLTADAAYSELGAHQASWRALQPEEIRVQRRVEPT
jgi:hypothetical protein